jgi:hypothetical protein
MNWQGSKTSAPSKQYSIGKTAFGKSATRNDNASALLSFHELEIPRERFSFPRKLFFRGPSNRGGYSRFAESCDHSGSL